MTASRYPAFLDPLRRLRDYAVLPLAAKLEDLKDRGGLPTSDPGIDEAIEAATVWLARAQDQSPTKDGGVAHSFSLVDGWASSYPETTGYIVPTLLALADLTGDEGLRQRARRMLDWLLAIQLEDGSFQGGRVDADVVVPVTFNTGQILLGLAEGAKAFGEPYRDGMQRAADWLVATQDEDGCWRKHPTPFAEPGEKAYETHVAWGLYEAARVDSARGYQQAADANVAWALSHQRANGWFDKCCLTDPTRPLTHTLGYVLRGLVEAHRFNGDESVLAAARKTADGLSGAIDQEGFLPGRLLPNWRGAAPWACLTGSVQIAHCWLMLYEQSGETRYREAAFAANRYVRRTVKLSGEADRRGGVKGSFPVSGAYGRFRYLNWAAKFMIDSNLLEKRIRESESAAVSPA